MINLKKLFDRIRNKPDTALAYKTKKVLTSNKSVDQYIAKRLENGFYDIVHRTELSTPTGIKFSDTTVACVGGLGVALETLEDMEADLFKKHIEFKKEASSDLTPFNYKYCVDQYNSASLPNEHFSYFMKIAGNKKQAPTPKKK